MKLREIIQQVERPTDYDFDAILRKLEQDRKPSGKLTDLQEIQVDLFIRKRERETIYQAIMNAIA